MVSLSLSLSRSLALSLSISLSLSLSLSSSLSLSLSLPLCFFLSLYLSRRASCRVREEETRKHSPLGPYRRPLLRVLGGSWEGERFFMGEVLLHVGPVPLLTVASLVPEG